MDDRELERLYRARVTAGLVPWRARLAVFASGAVVVFLDALLAVLPVLLLGVMLAAMECSRGAEAWRLPRLEEKR